MAEYARQRLQRSMTSLQNQMRYEVLEIGFDLENVLATGADEFAGEEWIEEAPVAKPQTAAIAEPAAPSQTPPPAAEETPDDANSPTLRYVLIGLVIALTGALAITVLRRGKTGARG
jgi:hypothetical protein